MNNKISNSLSFYKNLNNNQQQTIQQNKNNDDNDLDLDFDDLETFQTSNNNNNNNNGYRYKEITLEDLKEEEEQNEDNDNLSEYSDDLDFDFESTNKQNDQLHQEQRNHTTTTTSNTNKAIDENDLLLISNLNKSKSTTPLKFKTPPPILQNQQSSNSNLINNTRPIHSILGKSSSETTPMVNSTPRPTRVSKTSTSTGNTNSNINSSTKIKNKSTIVTICENKTREIGYSSFNQETGEIETGQFCDSQTYFHLYNKLYILNPSIIIIPPIEQNREMVKLFESRFPNSKIISIVRKLFNETDGNNLISQYCLVDKLSIIEKCIKDKPLAQSSFSSLVKYLEQEITFVKHCVKIVYSGSENSMQIDVETIKNLELIHSTKDGSRNCTLYESINFTKTNQGSRLLISAIVQPSNDLIIIKHRQEAIKQLLSNEKVIYTLGPILSRIQDIDKILLLFSQNNTTTNNNNTVSSTGSNIQKNKIITTKTIETYIKNFIEFKNIFEILPKIIQLLNNISSIGNLGMLKIIYDNLSNGSIVELLKETSKVLNDKVQPVKQVNGAISKVIQYIKDGVNGLLDVCKKTYKEVVGDINKLTKYYQDNLKLPQLKLHYCITKGYYYSLPCKNKSLFHLPNVFNRATYNNQKCIFFSEALSSLSRRCKEVFEEIIILSAQSIEKLIEHYRTRISELYNISESISQLDFLVSGALYSLQLDQSTCPELFPGGPLGIKSGYHPLKLKKFKRSSTSGIGVSMNQNQSKNQQMNTSVNCGSDFVPNDTLINETSSFQLIHGPNMSGKTTYIQQVALLTIVAHIGYFLPAEFATVPLVDHIISRLGTSDSIQSNASTFMTEMKDISYIIENATENSLVIIDELGRGTSNMDGSSIAWAISERLSQIGCYTLFVTHYNQLMNLAICYANIKIYHFQVSKDSSGLKYNYLLSEGVSNINRYGIDTAEMAGIDSKVIQSAKFIRNLLESKQRNDENIGDTNNNGNDNHGMIDVQFDGQQQQYHHPSRESYQLLQKLLNLKYSKLTCDSLKNYLLKLKNNYNFN